MLKIYHNPKCSKSRAALLYIEERGYRCEVIDYLKNPPSKNEMSDVVKKLRMNARDVLRKGEVEYKENNLSDINLNDDNIIEIMVKFPRLIERPIIINNDRACIARPLENLINMLDD